MKPKLIAYYLPQYHEIPENNEWWGKGFTEWVNVKKCKPFFKNHIQPKIPLNNNYYDLMDKKIVEWQTELANKYGIYGFCYFHYWFKNGRKILEKPAENLLNWKDINQNFCFFWANPQWQRTWSNSQVSGTTWTSEDKVVSGDDRGILLEQEYGDEVQWTNHFNYLLQFFNDNRYIKIDNKPFLAVYDTLEIPCAKEMFELWEKLAVQAGFEGMHIVSVNEKCSDNPYVKGAIRYAQSSYCETKPYKRNKFFRAVVHKVCKILGIESQFYSVWDYKFMWKCVLKVKPFGYGKDYLGVSVHDDDTPRRGSKALVYKNANASVFERNLRKLMKRAEKIFKSEFVFLDAWNEWGEGNYLEPDEQYGYSFLEAVKRVVEE